MGGKFVYFLATPNQQAKVCPVDLSVKLRNLFQRFGTVHRAKVEHSRFPALHLERMDDFVLSQVLRKLELVGVHRPARVLLCSPDKSRKVLLIFIGRQVHVRFRSLRPVLFVAALERSLFLQLLLPHKIINSRRLEVFVIDYRP